MDLVQVSKFVKKAMVVKARLFDINDPLKMINHAETL